MEIERLLRRLQRIRVTGSFGLPTWTHDITVTGRTASARHIVCIGNYGHTHCYAHTLNVAPTTFSVA